MRAAPHDGQMPRPLQEKATTSSAPQPSQCTRATPCASTPQRKNASISRRQKRGTERSFAATERTNAAQPACTARCSTVLSGSRWMRSPMTLRTQAPWRAAPLR
jgi:hypothetical protein